MYPILNSILFLLKNISIKTALLLLVNQHNDLLIRKKLLVIQDLSCVVLNCFQWCVPQGPGELKSLLSTNVSVPFPAHLVWPFRVVCPSLHLTLVRCAGLSEGHFSTVWNLVPVCCGRHMPVMSSVLRAMVLFLCCHAASIRASVLSLVRFPDVSHFLQLLMILQVRAWSSMIPLHHCLSSAVRGTHSNSSWGVTVLI